jgi:hypothetical protein
MFVSALQIGELRAVLAETFGWERDHVELGFFGDIAADDSMELCTLAMGEETAQLVCANKVRAAIGCAGDGTPKWRKSKLFLHANARSLHQLPTVLPWFDG